MTHSHPGAPTSPMKPGAPLDKETLGLPLINPKDVDEELIRAQVELLYAIARHRKAWAAMRAYARDQEARQGPQAYLDSDPTWKVKTGDVQWWRGEMTAQAAAVTALKAMVPQADPMEGWIEATNWDDRARNRRVFILSGRKNQTVRQTVYGWDPDRPPTEVEVQAANIWIQSAGRSMMPNDRARCERLIAASTPAASGS